MGFNGDFSWDFMDCHGIYWNENGIFTKPAG